MSPKISVCIPAYNRHEVLVPLLDSVLSQDYDSFDVVICEDNSPQRARIRETVAFYQTRYPGRINYFENKENLGYDANIRNLIARAEGEYCFFMGNDDLMRPKALATVAAALGRHPNIGVVLRSYAAFDGAPENVVQTFRYFAEETFFEAGQATAATFYRRCVVIPGLVLHRAASLRFATERFDGTLLYQLYLVANLLQEMNGISLPQILVLYRNGGVPDFGNSKKEKGNFMPGQQTPESSLHFVKGMLEIPAYVDVTRGSCITPAIFRDMCYYSYPLLSIQARQPFGVFVKYTFGLAKMGFWKSHMFWAYFFSILLLGAKRVDKLIVAIKERRGATPAMGGISKGSAVK